MGTYIEKNSKSKFFVGPEVEYTAANGKKTLFVVGMQKIKTIEELAIKHKTPHIFFGTANSFLFDGNDWDRVISHFLERGYMVSVEYSAHQHEKMLSKLSSWIWQSKHFIPVLSVKIPNIEFSNPNLILKIDDSEFQHSNAGVWCYNHQELMDSNRMTGWQEYDLEEINYVEAATEEEVEVQKPIVQKPIVQKPAIQKASNKKANPPLKKDVKPEIKELEEPVESLVKNDVVAGLDLEIPQIKTTESEKITQILSKIDADEV